MDLESPSFSVFVLVTCLLVVVRFSKGGKGKMNSPHCTQEFRTALEQPLLWTTCPFSSTVINKSRLF